MAAGTVPLSWALSITASNGTQELSDSNRTLAFTFSTSSSDSASVLTLVWHGFFTNAGTQHPNAVVQLTVTLPANGTQTTWHWSASNLGGLVISSVSFPYVTGIGPLGTSGSDDVLVVPSEDGRLFHDPYDNRFQVGLSGPSGLWNMQFFAYYDSMSGFFFSTQDSRNYTKSLTWAESFTYSTAGDFQTSIQHSQDLVARNSLEIPYDAVIGVFTGDWSTAADMYKSWAYSQSWTSGAQSKKTPEWLRNAGVAAQFCAHKCEKASGSLTDMTYAQSLQYAQQIHSYFNMPVIDMLWGWEQSGEWGYGDWFPPEEGWTSFDAASATLHAAGDRKYVFISPWLIDMSTNLWQSGTLTASAIRDVNQNLVVSTDPAHQWASMDITSDPWRSNVLNAGVMLASHGVDLIQLDEFPITPPKACFNPLHTHPAGAGGNWQTDALLQFAADFRSSVEAANPVAAITGELGDELVLPWMDMFYSRDNWVEVEESLPAGVEPVPLFEYVYHPWIVFYGADELGLQSSTAQYSRLSFARILTWGQIPNVNQTEPGAPNTDTATFQFLRKIAQIRAGIGNPYLVGGSMLPPLPIASPTTAVNWTPSAGGTASALFPAVQHSEWTAADGSVGIVLTNISNESLIAQVPLSLQALGLPDSQSYTAELFDNAAIRSVRIGVSSGEAFSVQLAPLDIALIRITPTHPPRPRR
jgi:hypothetical protein